MTVSTQHKLALALSLLSAAICLSMYVAIRENFSRGFQSYLTDLRVVDAQRIADFIEQQSPQISLAAMRKGHRAWHHLEQQALGNENRLTLRRSPGPPRHRDRSFQRVQGFTPPPPAFIPLDEKLRPVLGRPFLPVDAYDESWPLVPIATGGYIAVRPVRSVESAADQIFVAQQNRYFLGVSAVALLLSVILAWPLSRFILSPLRKLSTSLQRIAQNDYSVSSSVHSNDELGALSLQIENLASTLDRHRSIQKEWLAQISHDLRTPIAVLYAEIELIKDGVRQLSNETLQSMEEEIKGLARLIDEFHQYAILDTGQQNLQIIVTSMTDLIHTVDNSMENMRDARSISFTLSCGDTKQFGKQPSTDNSTCEWPVDETKLRRVFQNLMLNSIRYTDKGGIIRCLIKVDTMLTIYWEDSAPSVDVEDLPHLFEAMYRGEKSRNRATGGSGLGLAIVLSIVQLHGGEVLAEKSDLGGLKLTIVIPPNHTAIS